MARRAPWVCAGIAAGATAAALKADQRLSILRGMNALSSRLTYANVMATLAVFVALGGTGYAAISLPKASVGAKQLKKGSVMAKKIKKGP